ncbi:hypothetical protein E2C01_016358 [Portunus trituberculatus]|uniref:Uncharacterized protein n=1 Tax=Portunus trituberculatus TaxID=210409 RepID=A0A5B7DQJ3_PORTR|nr:hypothetical protein [Portunus trituberculatus]
MGCVGGLMNEARRAHNHQHNNGSRHLDRRPPRRLRRQCLPDHFRVVFAALLAVSVFLALPVEAVEVKGNGGVLRNLPQPLVLRAWDGATVPRVKGTGSGVTGEAGSRGRDVQSWSTPPPGIVEVELQAAVPLTLFPPPLPTTSLSLVAMGHLTSSPHSPLSAITRQFYHHTAQLQSHPPATQPCNVSAEGLLLRIHALFLRAGGKIKSVN